MDYAVIILPPPKSMTENMTKAKWTTYLRKLLVVRPRDAYRKRKLTAFHRSPDFRTAFTNMSSEFNIDRLQRSAVVMGPDDCIRAAAGQVLQSFRQFVNSTMPQAPVESVPNAPQTVIPAATITVAPAIVSSTHHFDAPVRRLVPTFTDISSSLAPLYVETAMFALRAQQCITNWDSRLAYVFNNATRYLSLVHLDHSNSMINSCFYSLANIHSLPMTRGALCSLSVTINTALLKFLMTSCFVISSSFFTHRHKPSSSRPTSF